MNVTFSCPATEAAQKLIEAAVHGRNATLTILETISSRTMYRLVIATPKDAVTIADGLRNCGITDLYLLSNRLYSELDAVNARPRYRRDPDNTERPKGFNERTQR